ncbi:PIN domain-containing protein [Lentinula raphanica]|nr:PIN domain-containing protein [Lentinula raphanica]
MSLHSPLQPSTTPSYQTRAWDSTSMRNYHSLSRQNTPISDNGTLLDYQNLQQQFTILANEDVEMQAPMSAENSFYVVPDTNILLHYLDALAAFADDIERSFQKENEQDKHHAMIVIPFAVAAELDWQKKDIWFSRKAIVWMYEKSKKRNVLKGQADHERLKACDTNDRKIIDCALYFAQKRPTLLCSADRNLCFQASSQGEVKLAVMNPLDFKNPRWSSRVMGSFLFGPQFEHDFEDWSPTYTERSNVVSRSDDTTSEDMSMDVDIDHMDVDDIYKEDAQNRVHKQICDVFVTLLRELVASDQRDCQRRARDGAAASIHAPSSSRSIHAPKRDVKATDMTIADILDYVSHPPSCRPLQLSKQPSLDRFLSKPYKARTGWRKGNDWSRQDWRIALRDLRKIGQAWDKKGSEIVNILEFDLLPHLKTVFADDDFEI